MQDYSQQEQAAFSIFIEGQTDGSNLEELDPNYENDIEYLRGYALGAKRKGLDLASSLNQSRAIVETYASLLQLYKPANPQLNRSEEDIF